MTLSRILLLSQNRIFRGLKIRIEGALSNKNGSG
jgi:hypothetical protein